MRIRVAFAVVFASCAVFTGSAAAEGIVPVEGPWSATTSAGLPVSFEVHGATVYNAHFGFKWGFCGSYESHNPNADPIDAAGHWSYLDTRGQTIEATFVAPDRVEGTVVAQERELPGCPATRATFVAAPGAAPPAPKPKVLILRDAYTGAYGSSPREIVLHRRLSSSLVFRELVWHGFGEDNARAHGRALIKRGKRVWRPRVSLRAGQLISRGTGRRIYVELAYTLSGPVPPNFPRRGVESLL
jgi:hypothetical protein